MPFSGAERGREHEDGLATTSLAWKVRARSCRNGANGSAWVGAVLPFELRVFRTAAHGVRNARSYPVTTYPVPRVATLDDLVSRLDHNLSLAPTICAGHSVAW